MPNITHPPPPVFALRNASKSLKFCKSAYTSILASRRSLVKTGKINPTMGMVKLQLLALHVKRHGRKSGNWSWATFTPGSGECNGCIFDPYPPTYLIAFTSVRLRDLLHSCNMFYHHISSNLLFRESLSDSKVFSVPVTVFADIFLSVSLKVYDGSSSSGALLANLCGSTTPAAVYSSGNQMYVTFTSDSSVTYSGFSATVSFVDESAKPAREYT